MLFKKKPATRTEVAAEMARNQAAVLREKAAPLAVAASERASTAAGSAKDWAAPRLAHARDVGLEKAAPRVEQAAKAIAPRVDTVHDKLVDDLLPKMVEAVSAAAAVASSKADDVQRASHVGLDQVAASVSSRTPAARRQRGFGKGLVVLGVFAALGGVAFALFRRLSGPTEDPWAAPISSPINAPVAEPTPAGALVDPAEAAAEEEAAEAAGAEISSAPSAAAQSAEPVVEEIDSNDHDLGEERKSL